MSEARKTLSAKAFQKALVELKAGEVSHWSTDHLKLMRDHLIPLEAHHIAQLCRIRAYPHELVPSPKADWICLINRTLQSRNEFH